MPNFQLSKSAFITSQWSYVLKQYANYMGDSDRFVTNRDLELDGNGTVYQLHEVHVCDMHIHKNKWVAALSFNYSHGHIASTISTAL